MGGVYEEADEGKKEELAGGEGDENVSDLGKAT